MKKLTVELVPKTCWHVNVRSEVPEWKWEVLKRRCFRDADNKCEVCGGVGSKWPVECHEIWEYDSENYIQILKGLIALCPNCHQVKHIGLAGIHGNYDSAVDHLMKVNEWDDYDVAFHIEEAFDIWRERSAHEWELDITWLKKKNP